MTASQPRDVPLPGTRVEPITYVDVDPLIPTHLGTSAPHVHHRGSDRCLRNVDGPECLSGEALRARVAELEAENERLGRDKRVYREAWHAAVRWRKSMRAERDALQQRLDTVRARVANGVWWSIGDTHLVPVDEVMALLDVPPAQSQPAPTGMCQSRDPHPEHVVDGYLCIGQPAPETQPSNEAPPMSPIVPGSSPNEVRVDESGCSCRMGPYLGFQRNPIDPACPKHGDPLGPGDGDVDVIHPDGSITVIPDPARQQDEPARAEEEQA